jgi:hypothetical protein
MLFAMSLIMLHVTTRVPDNVISSLHKLIIMMSYFQLFLIVLQVACNNPQ